MKTHNVLLILSAVALTAITINATAGNTLLSPRAAGNQAKQVSGTYNDPNLVPVDHYTVNLAPRAEGNKTESVVGTNNDINPSAACRNMIGSPKAIEACAEKSLAPMPCCAVATTK